MSPLGRIVAIVAAACAAAVAVVVGAAVLQSSVSGETADGAPAPAGPSGPPPLVLDLGVRDDTEARELRRAERLYVEGRAQQAAEIFARYESVPARVGTALAAWPDGTVSRLEQLVAEHPRSALVRLHLGIALFWTERREDAVAAWREARRVEPDSASAVRAGDLLVPNSPRGLPTFVPSFAPPESVTKLAARPQLAALAEAAAQGTAREKILYGVALQRLGRPLSARRQYDAALAAAPANVEAQVAAAVARFDKQRPAPAFERLGPLARRYPDEPSVRFHLGLLLLWLGELEDAERQLRLARDAGPETPLGREAVRFLERLESARRS